MQTEYYFEYRRQYSSSSIMFPIFYVVLTALIAQFDFNLCVPVNMYTSFNNLVFLYCGWYFFWLNAHNISIPWFSFSGNEIVMFLYLLDNFQWSIRNLSCNNCYCCTASTHDVWHNLHRMLMMVPDLMWRVDSVVAGNQLKQIAVLIGPGFQ